MLTQRNINQKDGGEQVLLRLLDARFPERDQTDELAEVLNEVFSLRATEGGSLRAWVSRATDLFDRCERKGGVKFPEEARGFVLLKWSGLTEEQQAVVKGRSLGVLKREEISKAMRSCYPDFVVGRRKAVALADGENTGAVPGNESEVGGFDDVELFLADHEVTFPADESEFFHEQEVAEVLASTWKVLSCHIKASTYMCMLCSTYTCSPLYQAKKKSPIPLWCQTW